MAPCITVSLTFTTKNLNFLNLKKTIFQNHKDYAHPTPLSMPPDTDPSSYESQYSHHLYGAYQTAGGVTDYHMQNAMTPPSSVSPRENTPIHSYLPEPGVRPGQCDTDSPAGIGLRCNRSL